MTDFVVSITDTEQLAGISWAREQYNAALTPPPVEFEAPPPAEGEEPAPAPEALPPEGLIETDAEYVQWVMDEASKNYGQQKRDQEWQDAYEAEKAQRAGRAA